MKNWMTASAALATIRRVVEPGAHTGRTMKTRFAIVMATLALALTAPLAYAGGDVVTGWFGGAELNYIDQGFSKDSTKTSASPIYLIGGNRAYQANILGSVQGEPGFNPHWNLNIVHTAVGVTVQDIIAAGLASPHFATRGVLFDDFRPILEAVRLGLVRLDTPGLIVLCPVVSDNKSPLPDDFRRLTETSSF